MGGMLKGHSSTWMTLKVTFAVWNVSTLYTLWNLARVYYGMFIFVSESAHGLEF